MATRSILPPNWEVPQVIRNRVGEQAGRQRAMFADDHLLLILHQPPTPDEAERKGRFFWRKPDGTWISDALGTGSVAVSRHLDEFESRVEDLEARDTDAVGVDDYFAVLHALAPIHRAVRNLHQALQQAREMCPEDRHIIDFRDRAYGIERMAALLYDDMKNSLQFAVAQRAEEQAESSHQMATSAHRLNVLVAFFFPIATLSAIFGVNLKHGYEDLPAPVPFLVLVGLGLVFGFLLRAVVIRKP